MTDNSVFKVKIEAAGQFIVGTSTNASNSFNFSIHYCASDVVKLEDCIFYLRANVGPEPRSLVLNHEAADGIAHEYEGYIKIENSSSKKQCLWKISSFDDTPFQPDKPIKIYFSNIVSQTDPGIVEFVFEAEIDEERVTTDIEGELLKHSDQADIIYFYSTTKERQNSQTTPESIVPADERILPDEKLILKWYIHNHAEIQSLKLTQSGRVLLRDSDFSSDIGSKEIANINQNTDFVLSGTLPSKTQTRSEQIRVDVLNKGWNDSKKTVDDIKLIPSQIFNANHQSIYAVFLQDSLASGKEAGIYQTGNPFWGWTSLNASVPNDFATSPGVFCDDKLWFIGGSQIDPDVTSNNVSHFEAYDNKWKELEPAPWKRRMGHACLHVPAGVIGNEKEQVWVMGGCDENGNTLDDIWALDVASKTWSDTKIRLPSRRCMLSCAVFKNEIWVCGGSALDPLQGKIEDDIYVFAGSSWKQKGKGLPLTGVTPISASLHVFKDTLHLIGKSRNTEGAISPYYFKLSVASTMTWDELPNNGLKGWGEDTVSSFQLVNFNDKLLIAKALGFEKANDTLKVFVP